MKKSISWLCVFALILSLFVGGTTTAIAAEGDILMLYDGEGDAGNGAQEPWGSLAGFDEDYFTEGTCAYAVQAFYNGVYFFQNTATYLETAPDISGYDYIEFDIMCWYDIVCDLELSVVRNMTAHHGSDYEMYEVYLPAETFVHVKMPIKDFVTRDMDHRDKWDTETPFDPNDTAHFSGYSLDHVERLRFQLTYCKYLDGNDCDDIYVLFDNVCATKNGATHTHDGSQTEVKDIQYYADVDFDQMAADVVIDMIDALTGEDKNAVEKARDAYEKLTDAQKALVTNLAKLEEMEEAVKPPVIHYGDVDGDGKVSAADALEVLKSVVGKVTLTEEQTLASDVDGNENVNAADALTILKKVVGMIDVFPAETLG